MYQLNKKILSKILLVFISLISIKSFSQNADIKGVVIDKITKKTLPFVNIIYNNKKEGVSSDIDGSFEIKTSNNIEFLKFSYVGYETKFININQINKNETLKIKLKLKTVDITEVTVLPGENPAHRIINEVIKNRKNNNPENLNSYSYKSYNKLVLTFDMDNALKKAQEDKLNMDSLMRDSSYINARNTLDSMFLFMTESLSERKFKKPGKVHEKIIANRVSGLKDASLFVLATQLQSLSFYDEMITIADSRYVNPISKGSTRRYFFNIEDTTYNKRGDTIFIISYRPKKGKNFEALEGVLNINTFKYAIESVIAEPVGKEGLINVKIQQKYNLIDDKFWFPVELDTRIILKNLKGQTGGLNLEMIGIAKTYISDIEINKEIKNKEFGLLQMEIAEDVQKKKSVFWQTNRAEKLSKKELQTYLFVDSVGEAKNFDLKLKVIKTITKGFIPIKFVNIAINSLVRYNFFEGWRLGIGLQTNEKISSFFSVGGYYAYGFTDKRNKYGGNINFNIYKKRGIKLDFSYKNDVMPSAGYSFLEPNFFSTTEFARKDMTYIKEYAAKLNAIPVKYFHISLGAAQQLMNNTTNYEYITEKTPSLVEENYFIETAFKFRFSPKEKLAYIDNDFYSISNNSSPVFTGNVIKGFYKTYEGLDDYLKLEAKINLSFLTKTFGKTNLQVVVGKVWGEIPYFKLYSGNGNFYDFNIEEPNSFATMRMNEFLSDRFFSVYLRQDFGCLLFKTKKIKPKVILISSMTYGTLNNINQHFNIPIKTLEKGYFESGILVNSIFRQFDFIGYGFGVFYRYGDYAFDDYKDNFAYKLTFTFDL